MNINNIQIKKLQRIFSALSNENRLKIIKLCQDKELTIKEISKKLDLSHSKTSQNTSLLERENLIKKTRHKNNTVSVKSIVKISDKGLQL
jgi:DNA-binding transcriptional ArsR family regulator